MTATTGPAGGRNAVAEPLAAIPDPQAELELRRQLVREAYEHGRALGWREGYERGARLLEAEWPSVVGPVITDRPDHAELERRRWTVRSEQRTRETYGQPHPDDFPGRKVTAA